MPRNISYPTDSSSEFDRHMHSPEAEASRRETLMQVQKNHETPHKAFPDVKSVHVSSGKGVMQTLTPMQKSEAIAQLPQEVQNFLIRKPQHIQEILNGQTVPDSSSNGAGSVEMLVTNKGIEILSCTRDC